LPLFVEPFVVVVFVVERVGVTVGCDVTGVFATGTVVELFNVEVVVSPPVPQAERRATHKKRPLRSGRNRFFFISSPVFEPYAFTTHVL
jgi:hypothetical protein